MNFRVSLLIGCATSWYVPSGRFRLGMATNIPLVPSMILSPRITNASLNVMLAKAFSLSSSRSDIRTSVISSVIPCHPPRVPDLDPSKSLGPQPRLWPRIALPPSWGTLDSRTSDYVDAAFQSSNHTNLSAPARDSLRGPHRFVEGTYDTIKSRPAPRQQRSHRAAANDCALQLCKTWEFWKDNVLENVVHRVRNRAPLPATDR